MILFLSIMVVILGIAIVALASEIRETEDEMRYFIKRSRLNKEALTEIAKLNNRQLIYFEAIEKVSMLPLDIRKELEPSPEVDQLVKAVNALADHLGVELKNKHIKEEDKIIVVKKKSQKK